MNIAFSGTIFSILQKFPAKNCRIGILLFNFQGTFSAKNLSFAGGTGRLCGRLGFVVLDSGSGREASRKRK